TRILDTFGHLHACSIDPNQPAADVIPDMLTDAMHTEILATIDAANAAWNDTIANLSLSQLDYTVALGGQALADDRAEVQQLIQARQRKSAKNLTFDVLDVSIDAPGHAVVHTRETWAISVFDMGYKLLQELPPATYTNTYELEWIDGGWTVTHNQVR